MQKRLGFIIGVVVILGLSLIFYKKFIPEEKIHHHAGFKVFVDGKLQDFSNLKYMSIKLCGDEEKEHEKNEQLEKAHLHDQVGDVVHVEAEGAIWKDLFLNINYEIKLDKAINGYVNGKKVENIMDHPINSYDSAVIFSGKVDQKLLKKAVTKQKILETEKKSETC